MSRRADYGREAFPATEPDERRERDENDERELSRRLAERIRVLEATLSHMTAYASEADRERVLEAGFQAHVSKPIEPAALISAVAEAIRGARAPGILRKAVRNE